MDEVSGDGHAELLDDRSIEVAFAYDNGDEAIFKAEPDTSSVSIRRRPQCQAFFRDRRFHFAARVSTFLLRFLASTSPGS